MSKQALYDAFMAGYYAGLVGANAAYETPEEDFAEWYANAIATGERERPHPDNAAGRESRVVQAELDRQRDIEAEGQRAAIYHGGLAKRRRERDNS